MVIIPTSRYFYEIIIRELSPLPFAMTLPVTTNVLNSAFKRVFRPFVKLALSQGITYPALADMLKVTFVDVVRSDFSIEGEMPSDSRINLLTGIHRKEIRRLRESSVQSADSLPASVSLGAQLVGAWLSRPSFLDNQGHPRPLPRLASIGGDISFEGLVGSLSKDIRSRVVLDEWLRLGVAAINESDEVVLNAAAFIPSAGFDEKASYLCHNLHDHAAAAVDNLLGEAPPKLERSVHYNALSSESIAELEEISKRMGMEMLLALNRKANELEERDAESRNSRHRFTCGIYFYNEDMAERDVKIP